jgi:hypothetical protein
VDVRYTSLVYVTRLLVNVDCMWNCRACINFDHQMQKEVNPTLRVQMLIDLHVESPIFLHVPV